MINAFLWNKVFDSLELNDVVKCKFLCKRVKKYSDSYCVKNYSVFNKWKKTEELLFSNQRAIDAVQYGESNSIVVPNIFLQDCGLFVDLLLTGKTFRLEIWSVFGKKHFVSGQLPSKFETGPDYCFTHAQPHWNKYECILVWHFTIFDFVVDVSDVSVISFQWLQKRRYEAELSLGMRHCELCVEIFGKRRGKLFSIFDTFNNEYPYCDVGALNDKNTRVTMSSVARGGCPSLEVSWFENQNKISKMVFWGRANIFRFGFQDRYLFCQADELFIIDLKHCVRCSIKTEIDCFIQFLVFDDLKKSLYIVTQKQTIIFNKIKGKWMLDKTGEFHFHTYSFVKYCPITKSFIHTIPLCDQSLTIEQWFHHVQPFVLKKKDIQNMFEGQTYSVVEINKSDVYKNFNYMPYKTLTNIHLLTHKKHIYIHQTDARGILNNQPFVFRKLSKTHQGWPAWTKIHKSSKAPNETPVGYRGFMFLEEHFNTLIPQTLVQNRQFIVY